MNPPDVIKTQLLDDSIVLTLRIPEGHAAFNGHFPGHPILPGVVQLHWVMTLAQEHLGNFNPCTKSFQVKFTNVIQPGTVDLVLLRNNGRIVFEYKDQNKKYSSGVVHIGESS